MMAKYNGKDDPKNSVIIRTHTEKQMKDFSLAVFTSHPVIISFYK